MSPWIELSMKVNEPDSEPVDMTMRLDQAGYVAIISGSPDAPKLDFSAQSMTVSQIPPKVDGKEVQLAVKLKKTDLAETAALVLQKAGAVNVTVDNGKVSFAGDLGRILTAATDDGDSLYHNDSDAVAQRYDGTPALKVAAAWWHVLSPSIKELQKQGLIGEAQVVDTVVRRAIEPGNNFYSVPAAKVSEHIWLMSGMLIFYVLYTLWYGFAIFELFEGMGLAMTKSKVKQEG